jgi:UDP-N-acetylmuramoyl-tripeptide--D-alanyl-D-alanine ligase
VDEAAAAMGGRVTVAGGGDAAAAGERAWRGAGFDSRTIAGGDLFFALPGEHTDGHRFVARALAAGAAAAVVHEDVEAPAGAVLVRVDDTFRALHALVDHHRRRGVPARLAAITGSSGKTTTKELLAAALGRRFRVAKNEGNLNNLYGYPLSVLRMPADADWMVAEMGMSSAGELSALSRLARPDLVVFTCVRPVHLEFFDSVDAIAAAKAELLEGIAPEGLVVANADDPHVARFVAAWAAGPGAAARVVWYGREAEGRPGPPRPELAAGRPDVAAEDLRPAGAGEPGSRFTLVVRRGAGLEGTAGEERRPVHLALHGAYNVDNALAAAAAAVALGASLDDVAAAFAAAAPAAGRGIVHRLAGGTLVVDDTYNSNPDALARALAAAAELAGAERRRWAVLGDMLELGPQAPRFHREAGRRAAELGFDPVAGVGGLARELAAAAGEAGAEAPWFADAGAAAGWAADELATGDLVLVKGSRGVGLDAVVERLRAAGAGGEGTA